MTKIGEPHQTLDWSSRLRTTYSLCLTMILFLFVAGMIALPVASVSAAEIYTSAGSSYPTHFSNSYQKHYYEVERLDAVYFGGKEVVFFTIDSDTSNNNFLYYYAPEVKYSNYYMPLQLADRDADQATDLVSFKALVFNNTLYVFYAYNSWGNLPDKMYYRTATVDFGTDGQGWKLVFGEEKSILMTGAHPYSIISAVVMNGKINIIFADYWNNYNWYYVSSPDGLNFGPATWLYSGSAHIMEEAAGSTVFTVPDAAGGYTEKLMVAYAYGDIGASAVEYFFFDGESPVYGRGSAQTGIYGIKSIQLFAGTADDYTPDKYAIQVFCAGPSSSGARWSSMYHGQYTPSGTDGASGQWMPKWTQLSLSTSDQVYGVNSPAWSIVPSFTDEGPNQRMHLRLRYAKDSEYTYKMFGQGYQLITLQSSTYKSDLLEFADDIQPPQEADISTSPMLGVILGTPPYPVNNGVPTTDSAGTSTVELATTESVTFSTTWTATAGTAVSFGKKFGLVNTQAKLSAGVKHSNEQTRGTAVYQTDTLRSYNYLSAPGELGWALFLKPKYLTAQYILKGYDGSPLSYDGNTDELRVSLITYDGPNTTLQKKAFYLNEPSGCMGGTDCSTEIFTGMMPTPLSRDICAWDVPVTSTGYYTIPEDGYLPSVQSTQGDLSKVTYTQTTTEGVTNGFNAGFTASAGAFGFTAEGNVTYAMDFKTTTSMTQSLGFGYAVPACGPPGSTTPCISDVTVYPYMLVPNSDATGYNAPWISDTIRNLRQPKPWAITYEAIPSNINACTATSSVAASRIAVQKIQGTLLLNENKLNRDKLSVKISLIVPSDFMLNQDEWLHMRLGNYYADSNRLHVKSREFNGNNLVIDLEGPNPDSSITARFSYNKNTSLLDIALDADKVDLTSLYAYRFLGAANPSVIKANAVPFGLYLGGEYFANADAGILCTMNNQNVVCNFHGKN